MSAAATCSFYRPSHEQIAQKAFEFYMQAGQKAGREVEHWLMAEAMLVVEWLQWQRAMQRSMYLAIKRKSRRRSVSRQRKSRLSKPQAVRAETGSEPAPGLEAGSVEAAQAVE